uniref:RING-type domain-containing protein n=1 Tax=Rhodnius prolixus TaxID=13249 RepID=T1HCP5_RHOPR
MMPPLPNGSMKKSSVSLMTSTINQRPDQSRSESFMSQQWHGVQNINLYKESERLKTFDQWPVEFMPRHKMAEAGFYYLKKDDIVRCVFCGVEIGKWVPGDDPMVDHMKWSPQCRFVRKLPVGNVPLSDDQESGMDTCGPSGIRMTHNIIGETSLLESHSGFQKSRPPSFPQFATQDSRLRSYATWPVSLKLKPHILSDAGFFYTGKGDQTICYHCGGGLKDWEETDEPWVEHARWFCKCPYVLLVKGKEFVDDVCGQKALEDIKLNGGFSLGSSSTGDIPRATTHSQTKIKNEEEHSEGEESTSSGVHSIGSSNSEPLNDGRLCKICYTEEMGVVFLPCGHIVACVKCASSLTTCAVCRKTVTGVMENNTDKR